MAVSAILEGDSPKGTVPPEVDEFFLALEFGWTLEYIRCLKYRDRDIMTTLIGAMYKIRGQGKDVLSKHLSRH